MDSFFLDFDGDDYSMLYQTDIDFEALKQSIIQSFTKSGSNIVDEIYPPTIVSKKWFLQVKDKGWRNRNKNLEHIIEGYKTSKKFLKVEVVDYEQYRYNIDSKFPFCDEPTWLPDRCILVKDKDNHPNNSYTYILLWESVP